MSDQEQLVDDMLYRRLKAVQTQFGLVRIELGVLLELFRTNDRLWKGRAASFPAFLEEERIQANGARQFMDVARRLVIELKLKEDELTRIASANFRILGQASKVITEANKDDVMAILETLSERDARVALEEFASGVVVDKQSRPSGVSSLVRRYRELPDDQRLEFLSMVDRNRSGRKL